MEQRCHPRHTECCSHMLPHPIHRSATPSYIVYHTAYEVCGTGARSTYIYNSKRSWFKRYLRIPLPASCNFAKALIRTPSEVISPVQQTACQSFLKATNMKYYLHLYIMRSGPPSISSFSSSSSTLPSLLMLAGSLPRSAHASSRSFALNHGHWERQSLQVQVASASSVLWSLPSRSFVLAQTRVRHSPAPTSLAA